MNNTSIRIAAESDAAAIAAIYAPYVENTARIRKLQHRQHNSRNYHRGANKLFQDIFLFKNKFSDKYGNYRGALFYKSHNCHCAFGVGICNKKQSVSEHQ